MILVEIVVVGLVAYRIWKLLAVDFITQPLRERMSPGFWWDWLSCPWCSGTWFAVVVAGGSYALGWLVAPWLLVGVAGAVVTGLLGEYL